ncbi:MAG TPA: tetratricopeptide repeat protein [Candidatus Omnitrophota bacterium]|nr:tetratricopeptide repeat protein [Candidatus Omnitrophota bacterium]
MTRPVHASKMIFFLVIFALVFSAMGVADQCLAADKTKTKDKNKELLDVAAPEETAKSSGGQNVEQLINTLNQTLEENRRIRQSMRDLQASFEKMTLEKSDLLNKVRKVEQQSAQRIKDSGAQIDELNTELENSRKAIAQLQTLNKDSLQKKAELEKQMEATLSEKTKLQELLKGAILETERDQIQKRILENDAAVEKTMANVSQINRENVALKEQLLQSYFDLGNLFYDLGRFQEAMAQYQHVLEWDPNHAWAHHNLAIIYDYHLRKIKEATVHYNAYMHLKKPSEEARETRLRLWDLEHLSAVTPDRPLQEEFEKNLKI